MLYYLINVATWPMIQILYMTKLNRAETVYENKMQEGAYGAHKH